LAKNSILGLSKTLYSSGVAKKSSEGLELLLSERLSKKKYSGEWPWRAASILNEKETISGECRDVLYPEDFEFALNQNSPFLEFISKKNLTKYLSKNINTHLSHHYAHALSGLTFSSLQDSLIMVIDGAGSNALDLEKLTWCDNEIDFIPSTKKYEGISFYGLESEKISCLDKIFYDFIESSKSKKVFSNSPGMIFEFASEYIFGNTNDSGKVMGLAAFGVAEKISNPIDYLESLDWNLAFDSKSSLSWDNCEHRKLYETVAASVQKYFEDFVIDQIEKYKEKFSNLIIVGGGAMNCVANSRIVNSSIFENVLIPPVPGDEGISLGIVQYLFHKENKHFFKEKSPYLGRNINYCSNKEIRDVFSDDEFNITNVEDSFIESVSELIVNGNVLGWFQGRSEIGPRALGNRSIISRVCRKDLKNHLNSNIKFRESFRPYACTCLKEYAEEYFNISTGFESPYMSYTLKIKDEFSAKFQEVLHIDGTSRAQTLEREFNPRFYDLIKEVGKHTGVYSLLNTSLNIMGQPIVEDLEDLLKFFRASNVDALVVGNYIVKK
jgi:carbamoyltransferase